MNVAHFLRPKSEVAFMYDDFSVRQGIEKLKLCGYSAVPVITREDGKYVGTVSEGEFLKTVIGHVEKDESGLNLLDDLEKQPLISIIRPNNYPSVSIQATAKDLLTRAMEQNYVPVVDDDGVFIGIVTRRDIIKYFAYSPE